MLWSTYGELGIWGIEGNKGLLQGSQISLRPSFKTLSLKHLLLFSLLFQIQRHVEFVNFMCYRLESKWFLLYEEKRCLYYFKNVFSRRHRQNRFRYAKAAQLYSINKNGATLCFDLYSTNDAKQLMCPRSRVVSHVKGET